MENYIYILIFLGLFVQTLFTRNYSTASFILALGTILFTIVQFKETKIIKKFLEKITGGM